MIKNLLSASYSNDDEWDGQYRWYNRCREFDGTRVKLIIGDLLASTEHEFGSSGGFQFGGELRLCQEDIPEFYLPDNPDAKYDIHYASLIIWRWGLYLSIRGRVK